MRQTDDTNELRSERVKLEINFSFLFGGYVFNYPQVEKFVGHKKSLHL